MTRFTRVRRSPVALVLGVACVAGDAVAQAPAKTDTPAVTWGKPTVAVVPPVAPAKPPVAATAKNAVAAESQAHTTPEKRLGFPRLLPDPKQATTSATWSAADIQAAQKQCIDALKGLDLVAVGADPIKDGECGAAAPIELVSVGTNPQVTFSPTVTVTCDMAKALHTWVTRDLQPLARQHLAAPLIRIDTMSSYSCRTAYGRAKGRLSEHGKANAIDIRGFVTARAETADVSADWGPTERRLQAQIAAAKAAEAKAVADKAIAAKTAPTPGAPASPTTPSTAVAGSAPAIPNLSIGVRGVPVDVPTTPSAMGLSTGMPQPSRLGGPKKAATPARETMGSTAQGRRVFMRGAHQTACRVFGTVLGPEANQAHENHFHVDVAKRNQNIVICE